MVECLAIPPQVEGANPKVYGKGLTIDYGICKFKQRVLADCINKYEAEK